MYEPYIFAALNSAKVMLVIGTKEAYFNAVWVRNEWSRFIKIMERDHDKYLIPCYKDMDAYDLPMEMASFQAQDMGKIGFLQDLLYGIDKLFGKTARSVKAEEKPTSVIQNSVNCSALLERAQILIEDGDTKKADSLLEKVLNNDPKNAKAYFYKLLIDLNVKNADELNNFTRQISSEPNYIKAYRYADAAMKAELDRYSNRIEEYIQRKKKEETYANCVKLYNAECYLEASRGFQSLADYNNSRIYYERCITEIEKENQKRYSAAMEYIENCEYDKAVEQLKYIKEYKDSNELLKKCEIEIKRASAIKKVKDMRIIKIVTLIYVMAIAISLLVTRLFIPLTKYNQAERAYKSGNYDTAIALYDDLYRNHHDFKNAASKINPTKYKKADTLVKNGEFTEAQKIFEELGDFENSADRVNLTKASQSFVDNDYLTAINYVSAVGGEINIVFDTDGGNEISNEKFYGNIKVSSDDIPSATKIGYTFNKWKLSFWEIDVTPDKYNVNVILKASYFYVI